MKTVCYIEIQQPIGTFYLSALPAETLLKIVEVRPRTIQGEGIQREKSADRVRSVSEFCSDPDAIFPTPIIISVDKNSKVVLNEETRTISLLEDSLIGEVIDGQHRLWGIDRSSYVKEFELPVVFMFDLTTEEKAYIFSTINSNQVKVNKSLIYELFDVSTYRSPQKSVHQIARAMNYDISSPFYNRLKMLGKKEPLQNDATLSQATFAKSLLMLITRNAEQDARCIKRGEKLLYDERFPLRGYFIEGKDEVISKIMLNCFNALKNVFPEEWKMPKNNILWKTTGFRAVMYSLPSICRKGVRENQLTQAFFEGCFSAFRTTLIQKGLTLTSNSFPGGGEQNQKKLAAILCESIANIDIDDYNEHRVKTNSIKAFIDEIGELDRYELFDIAQVLAGGNEAYSTIRVKQMANGAVELTHAFTDATIRVCESDKKKYLKYIEDTYMQGMDADTWLGFEEALEKED